MSRRKGMARAALSILIACVLGCGSHTTVKNPGGGGGTAPQESLLDDLLVKYVGADGLVDYYGLLADRDGLDAFVGAAADITLEDYLPDAPPLGARQFAFWVNLYNAATLQLILDNLPVASIRDIGEPWDLEIFNVGGTLMSLNTMEHVILRALGGTRGSTSPSTARPSAARCSRPGRSRRKTWRRSSTRPSPQS